MDKPCWIRSSKGLHGPYSPDLLTKLAEGGLLKPDMDISTDGHTWYRADTLRGLFTAPVRAKSDGIRPALTSATQVAAEQPGPGPQHADPDPVSIGQRIDALPVSNTWKRRFHELETDPKYAGFNVLAVIFCFFYYLAKGLWKKGLSMTLWLLLFHLAASIVAAALNFSIHPAVTASITGVVFATRANRDVWLKDVHGETFWPHPAARWATWLAIPALITGLVLAFVMPPQWLALPQCDHPAIEQHLLGLIRQDGPMQLDGQSWQAFDLADIFELNRQPFPRSRHCHARLRLHSQSSEEHSYSIEYWLHFDAQGELRVAIH